MASDLRRILGDDRNLSITIGASILPGGGYSAMLMSKGADAPVMSRGETPEEAIAGLAPRKKPVLPGLE